LFIGTRTPSKSTGAQAEAIGIAQLAPEPAVAGAGAVAAAPAPVAAALGSAEPSVGADAARSEAVAATEAMPWLFADPTTADRRPTPGIPLSVITNSIVAGDDAGPEEAAQALSGLPYIDDSGEAHAPGNAPTLPRLSGKVHRIDFDVAGMLESIAARVRAGDIDVGAVDPGAGEAAALASVLAALLRQRAR